MLIEIIPFGITKQLFETPITLKINETNISVLTIKEKLIELYNNSDIIKTCVFSTSENLLTDNHTLSSAANNKITLSILPPVCGG